MSPVPSARTRQMDERIPQGPNSGVSHGKCFLVGGLCPPTRNTPNFLLPLKSAPDKTERAQNQTVTSRKMLPKLKCTLVGWGVQRRQSNVPTRGHSEVEEEGATPLNRSPSASIGNRSTPGFSL